MSIHNLDKIFRPAAVAVVGASEKEGTIGCALMNNLREGGYQGVIHPVNPRYKEIHGLRAYPSLEAVGGQVDLVVIATPIETVPSLLEQAGGVGAGGAIVISAGGKEIGEKGKEMEAGIKEAADRSSIRLIGPNCLGVVCAETKLNASFASHMTLPGKLAFISQSGAICTAILDLSLKMGIGYSYFVSVGGMLDVDFGDLVNYLGNDPEVGSIVLYIESLTNFRKFMSAARAVSRVKPIVVLKSGRSKAGARAAASHTGALAGEDDVYDAAFQRAGIVRVGTIDELFDCAELMCKQPRPAGSGLVIITNAGGPGVMAADALAAHGLDPVPLSPETMSKLNEVLPPYWSRSNPVDMLGDASPERFRAVVEICMSAPEVDSLLVMMAPVALTDPNRVAEVLCPILAGKRRSVFTVWMGAADVEKARKMFNEASIPTYETPERAVRAFMHMYTYVRNLQMLQQIPQCLPEDLRFDREAARSVITEGLERGARILTEDASKSILAAYGIPVNPTQVASSAREAVEAARGMGFPVAMKIHSPDITHKSDAGGVLLDRKTEGEVEEGFRLMMANAAAYDPKARLAGVTVQPMLQRPPFELILGSKRDPDFGPVILFGMGGVLTEVLKDRALALPPLNRLLARNLMELTRVYQLLRGYRNQPPANLLLLEEILIRISQLVTDFPEITELDINPMITDRDRAIAMDARIVVEPSRIPSPMHLAISPYPAQYESHTVTKGGVAVLVRPIKPEDAPLLVGLFNTMSPTSIYYRFFRPLRTLSHDMLARFTQIDYDRDIVMVAIQRDGEEEKMLGVVRLLSDPDVTKAEFAVAVGDPWHGKGVGAVLLERCIDIAKERGIRTIWGIVLAQNTTMLALGRKLGFAVTRSPEGGDYELRISLDE